VDGRNILITGASTGLGAETAAWLAKGNTIFVHYNASAEAARNMVQIVKERGGVAHLVQADLSKEEGCSKLFCDVRSVTDRLDVLVNNAGSGFGRYGISDIEWAVMLRIFALNTFAVMRITSLFVPLLEIGTNPCIVNITSVAARSGAPTATIYGAAKGAVDTFTRGSAKELAPRIRVNSIAPGVFETPFHDSMTSKEKLAELEQITALKRNGKPRHIALAVEFLVENDFITGECIDVNGGLSMR